LPAPLVGTLESESLSEKPKGDLPTCNARTSSAFVSELSRAETIRFSLTQKAATLSLWLLDRANRTPRPNFDETFQFLYSISLHPPSLIAKVVRSEFFGQRSHKSSHLAA
jgi:hypothetical protein